LIIIISLIILVDYGSSDIKGVNYDYMHHSLSLKCQHWCLSDSLYNSNDDLKIEWERKQNNLLSFEIDEWSDHLIVWYW